MEECTTKSFYRVFSVVLLAVVATTIVIFCGHPKETLRRHLTLVDPRTVEMKEPFYGIIGIESYEKYASSPLPDVSHFRYVTFGSSHTWGSMLQAEGYTRQHAYPWLLSPNVTNMAIPAHLLDYPALCFKSMVGDDKVFDVAVLEGQAEKNGWEPGNEEAVLARKLRERFPDIIIISLRHKTIIPFWWRWNNGTSLELKKSSWRSRNAAGLEKSDPLFVQKMRDFNEDHKGEGKWIMAPPANHFEKMPCMREELGPNTFVVDLHATTADPLEYMERFVNFTAGDFHHPSALGHESYATAIKHVVQKAMTNYPENPRINPWQSQDECNNWFEPEVAFGGSGGELNFPRGGFTKNCFGPSKCTLELVGNENESKVKGWIQVTNSFSADQHLLIKFMSTNPSHSKISYPKAKVHLVNQHSPSTDNTDVVADPVIARYGNREVHVVKTMDLGKIPPGQTTIQFTPLETTKEPFRLVAYMITDSGIPETDNDKFKKCKEMANKK